MFLGGLWHGAAWSYAIWGTAHGVLLAFERLIGVKVSDPEKPPRWTLSGILRAFITFNLVSALWLLFKLPDFSHVLAFARWFVASSWRFESQKCFIVLLFSTPVVLLHFRTALQMQYERLSETGKTAWEAWGETGAYACMAFLIVVNSGTPGEFIYFQF
jgi:alginate O-acetyltransferase complex protein AlgI